MSEYDPIHHLDFPAPAELAPGLEAVQYESFEDRRIKLLETFVNHSHTLDTKYGRVYPVDGEAYVDRLLQLEVLMRQHMANFGLEQGDLVEVRVPRLIFPAKFCAEFDDGEFVRARFERLAIYAHYDVAHDGEVGETLPFGMNMSVVEPIAIGRDSTMTSLEGISNVNPLISLHHDAINLQRVTLPD